MSNLSDCLRSFSINRIILKSLCLLSKSSVVFLFSSPIFSAHAELYFNPLFLSDDLTNVVDLSSFEKGQELPPGIYRADIYLNDRYITTRDITFNAGEEGGGLVPCFNHGQLTSMGVNTTAISGFGGSAADACVPFTGIIENATTRFDTGQQRLYLTVPQVFMSNQARGYINPDMWDHGINAGILNYNFTGNHVNSNLGGSNSNAYLNLLSGLNIGAWRLRDNTTWSYSSHTRSSSSNNKWQHVNTWLEHDVISLRSRLTLGDSYTNGDIFDGINFRGVQFASDDNMLPDSQKGFAPAVHGIARSTAQVSIMQNGYQIYNTTVPPGPFIINDLYAAGSAGDLQVTIKEADGSRQVFSIPYASVPILRREGHISYALTAAEYRSGNKQQEKPKFFQGTVLYGIPAGFTLYGGTLLADRYNAVNFGVGKNMGVLGGLSADITQANATLPDSSQHQGQSVRFLYNKSFKTTGTNLQLVGSRYSTSGYFNFSDTTYHRMSGHSIENQDSIIGVRKKLTDYYNMNYNKRGKLQLSISQPLSTTATFYMSNSFQTYWGTGKTAHQIQAGLNTAIKDINWNLSYSLAKNPWQKVRDQMLAVNINIPLSHWMRSDNKSAWRQASANYSMSNDMKGQTTNLAGVHGTLFDDNNLSYNVQKGFTRGGNRANGDSGYTSLNYRGGYGNANVGYSHSDNIKQLNYGFSGGVLVHADGMTLSQPLNDTVVLIKAPGASGVKLENQTGVRTDWRGYAVQPFAMEYRENRVALDTNSLADNVDLDDAVTHVVPTRGAIVRAEFNAHLGFKLLISLTYKGKAVPFGAMVTTNSNQGGSIVADNGQVYLSGMPLAGNIQVKWGDGENASCKAQYRLKKNTQKTGLNQLSVVCE
ncbi:fimbrial biogenesis usher protein [Serratia liquefaciens]|uniref:Fimbrial protein n=1 Tax=Serratia liquefaciens TaxID=614 RepID=A0A515D5W0_SERLI|nr:fimbrial biogenesis usher protein [Serratia liquefaciens]QDL35804.1 fimbrial protein [Serratia liquefaciens]